MIRLIFFILIFAIFMAFIVLNLEHKTDISFGLITFEDIPVFLSILASFALGMLFAIPLAFSLSRKNKKKAEIQNANDMKTAKAESQAKDKIKKEVSPYGID